MKYLLDTCVISEPMKKKPDPKVTAWLDHHDEQTLFLSIVTIGELLKGIYKLEQNSAKAVKLSTWLTEDLMCRFSKRIIGLDISVIATWGKISAEAEKQGKPLPVVDSLIAATSITHSLTLITRNIDDFAQCGVILENPRIL